MLNIDENKFNATLNTIVNMYIAKKVLLEIVSVDHNSGLIVLRLKGDASCPKCVKSSIAAKMKTRFAHIKNVEIIR
jgi:Fe-S cluster biogenesis protein NfuA